MSGASGLAYGIQTLKAIRRQGGIESHLIVTSGARAAVPHELDISVKDIYELADVVHSDGNLSSGLASGSFRTMGMIVVPCSVKTMSSIATSYSSTLVARAADVTLKERRPLVLVLRETPLHAGHIRLMADVTASGGIIYPPVPALYTRPASIEEMVDYTVNRVLDLVGVDTGDDHRWHGVPDLGV